MRRYNAGVTFRHSTPLRWAVALVACITLACNRAPEDKGAVRDGLMEHLSKNTGLDLKAMDVDINNVNFQGKQATATVSFKPKSSPDAGMSMNYTLERQGDKWVVQKTGSGSGHGGGIPETPPPPAVGEALPPGHPPVSGQPAPPKSK